MEKDENIKDKALKGAEEKETEKNGSDSENAKTDNNGSQADTCGTKSDNKSEPADGETASDEDRCDDEGSGEAEAKDPLAEAQAEVEKLKAEVEELKDKYLRSVAEFDNYRRRTIKEKTELILNGSERAVQAVLPVVDDMELAVKNADGTDDVKALKDGMELICKKLNKVLESLGVKKIETDNADFDTDYHEAVAMVPGMGDDKKGKVLDCVQAGYTLNDKVIRHAKVAVGQ